MFLPYVYKVTHKLNNKFYIGMRSANKVVAELDLGIKYFTSSKYVKNNFDEFNIEILAYFQDWSSAFEFENTLIKDHWKNPLLINRHYQLTISKFSMSGVKRPDLAERNKKRRKPKEERDYQCSRCNIRFIRLEFCHHLIKKIAFCSQACAAAYNGLVGGAKQKGISNLKLLGRPAWNKGLPNPNSVENAKKGAARLSLIATGRKRKYLADGKWTWDYPKQ